MEAMEEESGESDLKEGEEEEEEAEERKRAAGGRARGGKARGANNKGGAQAGKSSKGSGKGNKAKKTTKGRRKDDGDGAQENGVSVAKGQSGNKGGTKSKQRAGKKDAGKAVAKSGKSGRLSDDTPAVSNTVTKDAAAAPTALQSPSRKAKNKAKTLKKKAKGAETPEGNGVVGDASPAAAKSATKRKHHVS